MTELGKRLKDAREAKGLSLDDLQSITKIQKRYLQGIEEGNYSMMPGKFYVRAFIKQYAEAVGLELNELFSDYKEDIPSVHDEELPEQLSRVQTKQTIQVSNSKFMEILPKILLGVFIIGAAALLYYFFYTKDAATEEPKQSQEAPEQVNMEDSEELDKPAEDETDKEKEDEKSDSEADKDKEDDDKSDTEKDDEQPSESKQELVVVSAQGRATTYELKSTDKFELKVVTTGETWLEIRNGKGTSFFRGMMKAGTDSESQTIDFSKETEAFIVVGRAVDTQIFVNGEKLEFAVSPNEQVRQDITIRYVVTNE